jgi:NADH:ubiquinone oxidoreductase subunit 4 (subunit M)
MVQKLLSHRSNLFQRRRTMDLQALLVVAFMVSFDIAIAIWPLWRAHVRLNAQAEQEAAQG